MKHIQTKRFLLSILLTITALPVLAAKPVDLSESMKQSLVYLDISNSRYEQYQPWRQSEISRESGYGCAVGPYEILTTAENVMNANLIQIRRYGQNARVTAKVKVVDYEYNLCLLEINKDDLSKPFKPVKFTDIYPEKEGIQTYWLSSSGQMIRATSTLDRSQMGDSDMSFVTVLTYYATNTSRPFGDGELCCYGKKAIGLAAWGIDSDSGIIPAETINRFITHSIKGTYNGFASVGFDVYSLLDPTMRKFINMPDGIENGPYVSSVYALGTGSKELKQGDVILSINGHDLDAYGRYEHPKYDRIFFEHLISQSPAGEKIPFSIFRNGQTLELEIEARSITSDNMLIPYYAYGKQPEYAIVGGYVFQKLTRDFLQIYGSDWPSKVPPHLYHYYRDLSFKPTQDRSDIVILSHVLPTPLNQGYQQLSQNVVSKINGQKVKSFSHFYSILNESESDILEIEFEMDNPTLIIPTASLEMTNMQIAQIYGIPKLSNVNQ